MFGENLSTEKFFEIIKLDICLLVHRHSKPLRYSAAALPLCYSDLNSIVLCSATVCNSTSIMYTCLILRSIDFNRNRSSNLLQRVLKIFLYS